MKTAFENNYACLGVTCADIGGLYGNLAEGTQAADGRRLSEGGLLRGRRAVLGLRDAHGGEYDQIAGYEPGSQVTDHAAIDQDQKAMESFIGPKTDDEDFAKARKIYKKGGFSKSYAELTVPATPRAIKKGAPMYATSHHRRRGRRQGVRQLRARLDEDPVPVQDGRQPGHVLHLQGRRPLGALTAATRHGRTMAASTSPRRSS